MLSSHVWRVDTQLRVPSQSWFLSGREWPLTGLITASTWALRCDCSTGELTGTREFTRHSAGGGPALIVLRDPPKGMAHLGWGGVRAQLGLCLVPVGLFPLPAFPESSSKMAL